MLLLRQFRHLSLWTSQLLTVTTSSHYEERNSLTNKLVTKIGRLTEFTGAILA